MTNGPDLASGGRAVQKNSQHGRTVAWLFRDVLSGGERTTRSGRAHGVVPEGAKRVASQPSGETFIGGDVEVPRHKRDLSSASLKMKPVA